jgi:transposase-like protein
MKMKQQPAGNGINAEIDSEVRSGPARRVYSAEYKRQIVEEVNAAPSGGIGVILRREGLYSTTVDNWRKELAGKRQANKPGRRASPETPLRRENARLQRENARLQRKLEQAELIIDVQKKVARLLGQPIDDSNETR